MDSPSHFEVWQTGSGYAGTLPGSGVVSESGSLDALFTELSERRDQMQRQLRALGLSERVAAGATGERQGASLRRAGRFLAKALVVAFVLLVLLQFIGNSLIVFIESHGPLDLVQTFAAKVSQVPPDRREQIQRDLETIGQAVGPMIRSFNCAAEPGDPACGPDGETAGQAAPAQPPEADAQ